MVRFLSKLFSYYNFSFLNRDKDSQDMVLVAIMAKVERMGKKLNEKDLKSLHHQFVVKGMDDEEKDLMQLPSYLL